jgi:endonuclease YncB( thermonuclease family)
MIKSILRKSPDIHPLTDIRVIDGDTIEAQIILPFEQRVLKRIRLKGWWADEIDGPYAAEALAAKNRLESFVKDRALWLHAPSCRLDKYGRVVGHLMHVERIICAPEVLGELQLTEMVHKARSDQKRAEKARRRHSNEPMEMTGTNDEFGGH